MVHLKEILYSSWWSAVAGVERRGHYASLILRDAVKMPLFRMRDYLSCHFGSRFSMKAPMPSSASRAIMFSVITAAA